MYLISSSNLLFLSFRMLGILIVLYLLRLCLRPLSARFIKFKVSLASLYFLLNRSTPNKYLSSSKHFLKERSLGRKSSSVAFRSWKLVSKGFVSGTIIISSSYSIISGCDIRDYSNFIFEDFLESSPRRIFWGVTFWDFYSSEYYL